MDLRDPRSERRPSCGGRRTSAAARAAGHTPPSAASAGCLPGIRRWSTGLGRCTYT